MHTDIDRPDPALEPPDDYDGAEAAEDRAAVAALTRPTGPLQVVAYGTHNHYARRGETTLLCGETRDVSERPLGDLDPATPGPRASCPRCCLLGSTPGCAR